MKAQARGYVSSLAAAEGLWTLPSLAACTDAQKEKDGGMCIPLPATHSRMQPMAAFTLYVPAFHPSALLELQGIPK